MVIAWDIPRHRIDFVAEALGGGPETPRRLTRVRGCRRGTRTRPLSPLWTLTQLNGQTRNGAASSNLISAPGSSGDMPQSFSQVLALATTLKPDAVAARGGSKASCRYY
jgi:hypothetical protein